MPAPYYIGPSRLHASRGSPSAHDLASARKRTRACATCTRTTGRWSADLLLKFLTPAAARGARGSTHETMHETPARSKSSMRLQFTARVALSCSLLVSLRGTAGALALSEAAATTCGIHHCQHRRHSLPLPRLTSLDACIFLKTVRPHCVRLVDTIIDVY